jgi:hypothetical protein
MEYVKCKQLDVEMANTDDAVELSVLELRGSQVELVHVSSLTAISEGCVALSAQDANRPRMNNSWLSHHGDNPDIATTAHTSPTIFLKHTKPP